MATRISVSLRADCSAPASRMTLATVDNVLRQRAVPNRILGYELQQRRIAKVVPALEDHVLMHQLRMLLEIHTQTGCVAGIEQVDGTTKVASSMRS